MAFCHDAAQPPPPRHSHHGFLPREGCLRTPKVHRPPLDQVRACSCKFCWTQHAFLQQRSDSPNCMKPPASEAKSERPCSHPSSFLRESNFRHGTDSAEGSRCGLHTSCRSERPSQFSAADCLLTPRHHSEHTYVPRTPQTDDFALGTCLPQEPASAAKLFSPSNFKQSRNCNEKNLRMAATPGSLVDCMALSNQITLYSWYLIRHSGVHTAEVAVGGFLSPGTAGNERLETATIVQRIDKCRLLAKDGVEVRLMGLIDDCTTVSNGFSVEMVHSFLSGFPYIWNHLLDNEFQAGNTKYPACQVPGRCGLSGGVEMSQLSFEGCSNQEKSVPLATSGNKVPVSCDPACQVSGSCGLSGGVEMSHLSFEGCSNQEKSVPPPSGNEVPVFCDLAENAISLAPDIKKNIVAEIQTEKEATVIMNEEANTQPPSDDRIQPDIKKNLVAEVQTEKEATVIMNEEANIRPPSDDRIQPDASNVMNSKILLSSTSDTNLEEESKNVRNAIEETLQENTHFDQSRCKAIQEPKEAFHALNEEVRAVQTPGSAGIAILDQWHHSEENLGKLVDKEDKSMQKSQVSPRITRSMHRMKRHLDGDQNKISSVSNGADISAQFDSCALKDCEGEHSTACKSCVNTRFHTSLDTLFKKRVEGVYFTRSRGKSAKNDNRDGIDAGMFPNMSPCYYTEVNESPAETGQGPERFGWITASEKEKEIEKQERLKNSKTTPISKSEVQSINHLTRDGDLPEEVCAAEVLEVNGGNTGEAEENLSAMEEFVSLKEVEMSTNAKQEDGLKKRGPGIKYLIFQAKTRGKHPSKVKSSPVCYGGVVKEKTRSKAAPRRLTEGEIVDSPRYQSGSKTMNVAKEGKEVHVSCKTSMLPPPLPRPRVSVSKRLISAAFGLKTSRSGRLLVPPLAHWCSQSLLRDKDGGIIAISDGSKDMSNVDTGNFKFKPPAEAGLKKLQKRLREVATECTPKKKPASIKRKEYSK